MFSMRNPRPLASFTFDDVPSSACRDGAGILERHGCRGTFYVCGGLTSDDVEVADGLHTREDLTLLHRNGHEVASHGFAHLHYQTLSAAVTDQDLSRNDHFLSETLGGYRPSSFSFPFGSVDPVSKARVARRFSNARGNHAGINARRMDVALLRANRLYDSTVSEAGVRDLLREASSCNGWVIFYTHDVRSNPSRVGCSPELLEFAVDAAGRAGFEVLPVKHALARAAFHPA